MNKLDELYAKALVTNAGQTSEEAARRKKAAEKMVNETLSVIFTEIPKLNLIRVRGHTPGFNDGDPCTHSQIVAVDVYDPDCLFEELVDEDDELSSLISGEEIDWASRSWDQENKKYISNPLPEDPHHAACIKALEVISALGEEFELLFDTNFTLDIVRDTDSECGFRIDHNDYDCGY